MDDDDDRGPAPTGFVGGAIPEAARRAATPQAVREWMEQVSQQLARDERRQRDEARETIKRQELRRRRPTTRSQTAATAAQPDEGDQCRICFSGVDEGKLIAPCKCDGTQRYVHEECLRKWQRTCAGLCEEPAPPRYRAGVRNAIQRKFISTQVRARGRPSTAASAARGDLAPPAEPWSSRGWRFTKWFLRHTATFVVALLGTAAGMARPIVLIAPMVGIVVYWFCAIRIVHRGDGRVAIIRNGRPFRGVRAGRLLISRHIEHGVFGNSVVLLTEHDHRRGSFGLVINKREFRGVVELDERRDDLRGFFVGRGGPVDTREAVTMLYRAHLGPPPGMAHGPVVGDLPEGVRGCSFVDGGFDGGRHVARRGRGGGRAARERGAAARRHLRDGLRGLGPQPIGWRGARGRVAPRRRGGGLDLPDIDDRADLWAQLTREAEEQAAPGAR